MKHVLLDEEDFEKLTKGEIIEKKRCQNITSRYWV